MIAPGIRAHEFKTERIVFFGLSDLSTISSARKRWNSGPQPENAKLTSDEKPN